MAQINKSSDYFNTVLYTGNGSTQSISGVNFRPDWVWIKSRNTAEWHHVIDAVRGGTNVLFTNTSNAEDPRSGTGKGHITSFDTDGFTTVDTAGNGTNINGSTYTSWNWLAGGTASSNTDGSITSTVSANTTSGFSIVSYTGTGANATIGHGLGSAPKMIFVKKRSATDYWRVYSEAIGNTKYLVLNTTDGTSTNTTEWNDTSPTSSVFTVGSSGNVNASGATFVAYCFAEKKGFSKFGQYTGNGSTDGTFVYTGFKPAFIIAKETNEAGDNWVMFDNKRDGYNVNNDELYPNLSNGEADGATYVYVDLLSNGFKWRTTATNKNQSGSTYIYMCFAESPLVGTNNIPATAR